MPDPMPETEAEAALRDVERAWNAAALHWDPAGLAALFTKDAVFYGGRIGHSVGRAQVRAYYESYEAIFTTVRLALVEQELREPAPGIVLAQGYAAFEFAFKAGGESRATLRSSLVLVRRPEGWRILQHHFSPTPAEPPIPTPALADAD